MLAGMDNQTPFDLRWRMFGTDVRVHPLHWVMAAVLFWDFVNIGIANLVAAIFCVFFSVLIHEFGHVVAFRWFGCRADVLLWGFGGLAIPDRSPARRWQRIVVSAAGPAAQFILFGLTVAAMRYALPRLVDAPPGVFSVLSTSLLVLWYVNLFWPILNLLPIWPLDGGHISREVLSGLSARNGKLLSLQISGAVAGVLAVNALLALSREGGESLIPYAPVGTFGAIFFGYFAVLSFQLYQEERASNQWIDDHWR